MQAFALVPFQLCDQGALPAGGVVLGAFGIDLGERLVPLGLEIDARVGQIVAKDLQQIGLHFARSEPVEAQRAGQHLLEDGRVAGLIQLEDGEVRFVFIAPSSSAVERIGELGGAVREHRAAKLPHVIAQLGLLQRATVGQPKIIERELALVGEVLVVVADTLADAAQHHRPGGGEGDLEQHVCAVVREIEAPAGVDVVGTEVHAALVDDQQELQRIDETRLARVVWRDQRYCGVQRHFRAQVAGAVEERQALESILDHSRPSPGPAIGSGGSSESSRESGSVASRCASSSKRSRYRNTAGNSRQPAPSAIAKP